MVGEGGEEEKKASLFSGSQQNLQPEGTGETPPHVGKENEPVPRFTSPVSAGKPKH